MENNLIKTLELVASKLIDNKIIGNFNREELLLSANYILENILYLNIDIFKKGGKINPFNNFSSKILIFNTLSECLLELETYIDGIYLCYIKYEDKPNGFFGYFFKNNGNIFSINERLEEKYIGQYERKSIRNNSYSYNKKYDLFPYEIIDFIGEDSAGYAEKHIINNNKIEYKHLTNISLMNIIIMLYLFEKKYVGTCLSGNEVYTNFLLNDNIKFLINNSNQLIKYQNSSDLIKYHNELKFTFDKKEFLDGTLCQKFNGLENNRYTEYGYFQNINQNLVDVFGKDFNFDNAFKDVLLIDKKDNLLTENSTKNSIIKLNNEFIGTKNSLELQVFYNLRKKLAKHIIQKQIESLEKFGGIKQLEIWYKDLLLKNYDKIKSICLEVYNDPLKGEIEYTNNFCFKNEKHKFTYIKYYNSNYENINQIFWIKNKVNEYSNYSLKDIQNNKKCFHYFVFNIPNLEMIENILNTKFPDFCLGYYGSDMKPYTGNSILDVVDPVDDIDSILLTRKYNFSFDFVIGFSKSNFKIKN